MDVIINSACSETPTPDQVTIFNSEGSALLNFLLCLGYDPYDPPLADLLCTQHKLDGDWLILSPIYWQATHNDALIIASGKELGLQDAEAKAKFFALSAYLKADNQHIHYHDAETWLLQNNRADPLKAKPVHQLIGKSLMPELAQLDASLFWQKFITESQMLFASLPDQSTMNGVWPWGGAKLTDKKQHSVCVDETFISIAQECSAHVTLYHPSLKLKNYQILLLSEFSVLSELHQEELKKSKNINWYWNNMGYIKKSNWYTSLWRKLVHAH